MVMVITNFVILIAFSMVYANAFFVVEEIANSKFVYIINISDLKKFCSLHSDLPPLP